MKNISKILFLALCISGCTPQMSQIGSSILSSTGFVSGSQADAIFKAGDKLSKAAESVTDEQEYYLGRSVAASVLAKYPLYQDGKKVAYANKVLGALVARSNRPETFGGYYVAFLDTPQINAVSAPGGFIFISRGFLNLLENEDQLAAVIAHEIAHIALRHGTSAISESNLTDAVQILGKEALNSTGNVAVSQLNSLFGDSVNEVVGTLLDKGYSRGQEYDADEYAVTLLAQTGYNPQALDQVLHILHNSGKHEGGWFATHPDAEDRIDELDDTDGPVSDQSKRDKRFKGLFKK